MDVPHCLTIPTASYVSEATSVGGWAPNDDHGAFLSWGRHEAQPVELESLERNSRAFFGFGFGLTAVFVVVQATASVRCTR
jgi:hypothetical protein